LPFLGQFQNHFNIWFLPFIEEKINAPPIRVKTETPQPVFKLATALELRKA
jgi:hypothetical protein